MKSVVGTLHPILYRSHPTIPLSICCYVDSTAHHTARFGTNLSSRSSRWESRRYQRRVIRRGKRRRKMVKKTERAKQKAAVDIVVNRGAWTAEEDQKLVDFVRDHGDKNWRTLPAKAGLNRCGKSCRLRWLNYLRPGIKRGNISDEEEDLIIRLHNLLGNRWSLIAGRLPGRTDNEIKNHWNTHLSRRPVTIDDLNLKLNQQVERTCERGPLVSPVASSRDLTTLVDHVEDEWVLDGTAQLLHHSELDMDQLFALMPDPDGGASNGSEFGAEADGSGGEEGYRDINEVEISGAKTEGCSDAQAGWDVDLERFMGYDDDLAFYFLD